MISQKEKKYAKNDGMKILGKSKQSVQRPEHLKAKSEDCISVLDAGG